MRRSNLSNSHLSKPLLSFWFFFGIVPALATEAKTESVKMGIFDFYPMNFYSVSGSPTGIYVELIERIAELEGWEVEFVSGTWNEGLMRIQNGEIDLMPSIAFSEDRNRTINFNRESVVTVWGEVYIKPDSGIQDMLDLEGHTIAVMKGDISAQNFKQTIAMFNIQCQFVECATHALVMEKVQNQEAIGGVVPNIFGMKHYAKYSLVRSSIIFSPFPIFFGSQKGQSAFLSVIDRYLGAWKADRDSFYYQTLDKWLETEPVERTFIPKWLYMSIAISVSLMLAAMIWGRSLKYQVRKRTMELQESEKRFRDISLTMADWIWEVDENGRYRFASESVVDTLGYEPKEMIGKTPFDFMPKKEAKRVKKIYEDFCANKEPIVDLENWNLHKNGTEICLHTNALPILNEKGHLVGYRGIDKDMTGRRQAAKERADLKSRLVQAQKMEAIGTLAGGIAHDFNNILSAIYGFAELAEADVLDDPDSAKESIEEVIKAAGRARDLVKQILTFSRKSEAEMQPLQLSLVVKEALKLLRSSLPTTIEIVQKINSQAVIHADPTKMHQIIMNLCTNAYHAMRDSGGILSVSLKEADMEVDSELSAKETTKRFLVLSVSDNGIGMDAETRQKIFEPYFTTKESGDGTGLGLAVVHGIVQDHKGQIHVYSEPGQGTTFHIYLPVVEKRAKGFTLEQEALPIEGGSERIMVVDDEEAIVKLVRKVLTANGYHAITFTNGVQALQEFRKQSQAVDLLITDLTMPYMTGIELAKQVLEISPRLPIILSSGLSETLNKEKTKAIGIKRYLEKPIDNRKLLRTVRNLLDESN